MAGLSKTQFTTANSPLPSQDPVSPGRLTPSPATPTNPSGEPQRGVQSGRPVTPRPAFNPGTLRFLQDARRPLPALHTTQDLLDATSELLTYYRDAHTDARLAIGTTDRRDYEASRGNALRYLNEGQRLENHIRQFVQGGGLNRLQPRPSMEDMDNYHHMEQELPELRRLAQQACSELRRHVPTAEQRVYHVSRATLEAFENFKIGVRQFNENPNNRNRANYVLYVGRMLSLFVSADVDRGIELPHCLTNYSQAIARINERANATLRRTDLED